MRRGEPVECLELLWLNVSYSCYQLSNPKLLGWCKIQYPLLDSVPWGSYYNEISVWQALACSASLCIRFDRLLTALILLSQVPTNKTFTTKSPLSFASCCNDGTTEMQRCSRRSTEHSSGVVEVCTGRGTGQTHWIYANRDDAREELVMESFFYQDSTFPKVS
jgi:hypothetical protein